MLTGQMDLNFWGAWFFDAAIPEGHSEADVLDLERAVRQAIWDFEPRILRDTVKVHAVMATETMSTSALAFEIEGMLWAQPMPMRMFLKTEVDLETGHVEVVEEQ